MTCQRCQKDFPKGQLACPHCGEMSPSGLFQTSTVLISVGGEDLVYRTVNEVPPPLRSRLLKSTNGSNARTIVITDERGRREIAKSLRRLPGPAPRRMAVSGKTAVLVAAILLFIVLIVLGITVRP